MAEKDVVAGLIEMAGVAAAGAAAHQTRLRIIKAPTLPCSVQLNLKSMRKKVTGSKRIAIVGVKLGNARLLGDSPTGMLDVP